MAELRTVTKTSRIGPADLNYGNESCPCRGAAPVQWLIDGEWVLKGWLMPEVDPTTLIGYRAVKA